MNRPSIFYKYTTPSTALLILENSSLRWSSPVLFNDVAEFQRMPRFDPTVAEAHQLFPQAIATHLFDGGVIDEARLAGPMQLLLSVLRGLVERGLTRVELLEQLAFSAPEADSKIEAALRSQFDVLDINKARVLCVTPEPSNEVMWGTYADSHAGCVLGFRHLEHLSTPLLEARPVAYSEERPVVGSGLDFLLYGDTQELRERTLDAVCFTKKFAWSYEKEWRAVAWRPNEHGKQHGDYRFSVGELESVTVGVRASASTEERIRQLLARTYPEAALYRMLNVNGELLRSRVS